jgi:hypothetical protein
MDYFKAKVDAGADYIVTQLFFDNRDFLDFRGTLRTRGRSHSDRRWHHADYLDRGLRRMAELAGGTRFPAKLLRSLQPLQNDPETFRRAGIQYALEQCRDLLANGVAGIHFYTLNRSDATRTIFDSLGTPRRRKPARFARLAEAIDSATLSELRTSCARGSNGLQEPRRFAQTGWRGHNLGVLNVRRMVFWQAVAVVFCDRARGSALAVLPSRRFCRGFAGECDELGRLGRSFAIHFCLPDAIFSYCQGVSLPWEAAFSSDYGGDF